MEETLPLPPSHSLSLSLPCGLLCTREDFPTAPPQSGLRCISGLFPFGDDSIPERKFPGRKKIPRCGGISHTGGGGSKTGTVPPVTHSDVWCAHSSCLFCFLDFFFRESVGCVVCCVVGEVGDTKHLSLTCVCTRGEADVSL